MANQRKRLGTGLENRLVELGNAAGVPSKKQPLSGVLKEYPNDVQLGDALAECKVRAARLDAAGKKHLTFNLEWLDKVLKHAKEQGFRHGVVVMRPKGSQQLIAMLDLHDYLELLGRQVPLPLVGELDNG